MINGLLYWYDLHSDIYYLDYGNISEREKGKKHIEYIYTYFFFFSDNQQAEQVVLLTRTILVC